MTLFSNKRQLPLKRIWIFGSRDGLFYDDNSKHFYEFISAHYSETIEAIWITKCTKIYHYLKLKNMKVALHNTADANTIISKSEIAFINISYLDIDHYLLKKYPHIHVIQLWHGTPMKNNDLAFLKESYKFVSIASTDFLTNQELGARDLFEFRLTGYPRNDILLNNAVPPTLPKTVIDRLINKKVILFVPTYTESISTDNNKRLRGNPYNIWNGLNISVLDTILNTNNAIFIIKLHPLQSANNDFKQSEMFMSNNFIFLDNNDPFLDIYAYLKYTDILLTDYSSILFDYLLLNKPVIFTAFDLQQYNQIRTLRYNYDSITPGKKAKNWDEVLDYINEIFNGNDEFTSKRESINNKFNYYKDANSCERIFHHAMGLKRIKNSSLFYIYYYISTLKYILKKIF